MRRRELALRKLVDGGLVRADLEEVRIRADLVERAAQKDLVGRDAGQIERACRQQEDAIGSTGEVVLPVAAVFEKRDDSLARLPEVDNRVAQLLDLGPKRQLEGGGQQQDARDPRIALGLAQALDKATNG